MPREPTRERAGSPVELKPVGGQGLNLNDDPAMLSPQSMRQARNVDTTQQAYARRAGDAKASRLTDQITAHGSKVFGTAPDTMYARFMPPLIGYGGFAVKLHTDMLRGLSGTGWMISSWTSGAEAHYVVKASLTSAGLFTISVEWDNGSTSTISVAGVDDATNKHVLLVYDAKAAESSLGTLTLYFDGDVVGTPITALPGNLRPRQDAGVYWYFGLSYQPGTGIDLGTTCYAALDAFTLFTFAGVGDIEDEDLTAVPPRTSLLSELRKRSWQEWPAPEHSMVLVQFGMDEETAGTGKMWDSSEGLHHGDYFGDPTNADAIALRAQCGNFIGTTRRAAIGSLEDGLVNIVVAGGQHYYQVINPGSA